MLDRIIHEQYGLGWSVLNLLIPLWHRLLRIFYLFFSLSGSALHLAEGFHLRY